MIKPEQILVAYCLMSLATFNAIAIEQADNVTTNEKTNGITATKQGDAYESGTKYFNNNEYEQSLTQFNKVLSQEKETPKLSYSLGSIHYKLGNYSQSRDYFLKLTKNEEYNALAYYNLGLISHKEGNVKAAIKYFEKSKNTTRSTTLKRLSTKQIATLTKTRWKEWVGYASAGYGHDSNITSAPTGVATNKSGSLVRASALASLIITESETREIFFRLNIYATDYIKTSFNDDRSLAIDLGLRESINQWRLSYDAGIKQSAYGDNDFQRTYRLTFNAKTRLTDKNELRLRYRYEDINSLNAQFDYLDGSRQKLRVEYIAKQATARLRLQYALEFNDRQNTNNPQLPATGNFSPTRHKVAIRYDNKIDLKNSFGSEVEYRNSNYDATTTQNRSDIRLSAAIQYSYNLDRYWKLKTRIKYRRNDSNEPGEIFDYERTTSNIDLSRQF